MSGELLRVFVYGTLKRGERNHARYCGSAVMIEPASVLGRLFFLRAGYPMLQVPSDLILATGTSDPMADLATQLRFGNHSSDHNASATDDWEPIEGEILSFAEGSPVLSRLDRLEDFRPDDPAATYLRALVPLLGGAAPAWTYVAPNGRLPIASRRIGARWP